MDISPGRRETEGLPHSAAPRGVRKFLGVPLKGSFKGSFKLVVTISILYKDRFFCRDTGWL